LQRSSSNINLTLVTKIEENMVFTFLFFKGSVPIAVENKKAYPLRRQKNNQKGGHAMRKFTKKARARQKPQDQVLSILGPDPLTQVIRREVRRIIETIIQEELEVALGAGHYQRVEQRRGYRNGSQSRSISTSLGKTEIEVPRGRFFRGDEGEGKEEEEEEEWHSHILPRYSRRARAVDDAILGIYLSGANTRRIKGALRPLLRGTPLSKSSISRIVVPVCRQAGG
jgi:hypothetical protein